MTFYIWYNITTKQTEMTQSSSCVDLVSSIECFQCYVKSPPRSPLAPAPEFEPLCSLFDGSDDFLVNCTQSTFCMTRTYRLHHRLGRMMGVGYKS